MSPESSMADQLNTWQLPRPGSSSILTTDLICGERQQVYDVQTALKVSGGDKLILEYNENGHITFPEPLKPSSGDVYVYGTDNPQPNTRFRDVHKVWPKSASAGIRDGGALLAHMAFDDEQCYQYSNGASAIEQERRQLYGPGNSSAEAETFRFCQNIVRLPMVIPEDSQNYTIYWVWDWPDRENNPQVYTSCLDLHFG